MAAAVVLPKNRPKTHRRRVPWPQHARQRSLFCLVCQAGEICAKGLCRHCYDVAYRNEVYFAGAKERVLARDGHRCRVCAVRTNIVHHRQPGVDADQWLITMCAACHATVERLAHLDRYLPPLLRTLWREQHPYAFAGQRPFSWAGEEEETP